MQRDEPVVQRRPDGARCQRIERLTIGDVVRPPLDASPVDVAALLGR